MGPVGGNQKPEAAARGRGWHCPAEAFPARACGMEARGEAQHRTQVNPRKAGLSGQACLSTRRPVSNRGRTVMGAAAAGSRDRRAHPSAETSCCTQRTARQRAISAPGIAAGWAGDSRGRSGAWPSFRCDSAARICPSRPLRSSFLVGHHRDASRSRGHDLHAFTSRQTCRRAIRPRAAGSSCRSPLRATPAREDAAPPSRLRESRELARLA